MPAVRVIAFGLSLLIHSAIGVVFLAWSIHHRASSASLPVFQPAQLALVLVSEEPATPAAPASAEVVKTEIAPPLPPTLPAPTPAEPVRQSEPKTDTPVLAETHDTPVPDVAPVTANNSPPVNPVPVAPAPAPIVPGAPAIETPATSLPSGNVANIDLHPSPPVKQSDTSQSAGGDAFLGYRYTPRPAYPASAKARGWEGTVSLIVRFLPDGKVADVKVKESSGHDLLDDTAVAMMRKYIARLKQGSDNVVVEQPIRFQLTNAGAN